METQTVADTSKQFLPEIADDAATFNCGTDRYPCTIVSRTDKRIEVSWDDYSPAPDCDYFGDQRFLYSPGSVRANSIFTLRKNGRWVKEGDTMNGFSLTIGRRRKYSDPSF